ncbi:hypothetical protein BGLA2_2120010 [Burkholderia gladioli]|nr:hypothetical protein BGLA2_2120010 [Burkholderia gladioli]
MQAFSAWEIFGKKVAVQRKVSVTHKTKRKKAVHDAMNGFFASSDSQADQFEPATFGVSS